jgi:hypothetical protein
MVHLRSAALAPHPPMRFFPVWFLIAILCPVHDGGFVTPFEQFRHGRAMRARGHEGSHGGLVGPDRARPKGVARVAQNTESKVAIGPPRLRRRPERRDEKRREVSPRPHP